MSVSSSSTDVVQAVIDILEGYTTWTNTTPEVYKQSEVPQSERESASNPRIYVWSPVDESMEGLGAKREKTVSTKTIECSAWVLTDSDGSAFTECEQYKQDIIDILEDYVTDNYANIEFLNIRPSSSTDSRQERIAQRTDHYVMSVQAESGDLRDSGT